MHLKIRFWFGVSHFDTPFRLSCIWGWLNTSRLSGSMKTHRIYAGIVWHSHPLCHLTVDDMKWYGIHLVYFTCQLRFICLFFKLVRAAAISSSIEHICTARTIHALWCHCNAYIQFQFAISMHFAFQYASHFNSIQQQFNMLAVTILRNLPTPFHSVHPTLGVPRICPSSILLSKSHTRLVRFAQPYRPIWFANSKHACNISI